MQIELKSTESQRALKKQNDAVEVVYNSRGRRRGDGAAVEKKQEMSLTVCVCVGLSLTALQ